MAFFIFLLTLVDKFNSLEIIEMDSQYQYSQQSIELPKEIPSISSAFRYGLWSKYNPLTNISKVGSVGLFDSNCFLLHLAIEDVSQALNLIYYDCLDEASNKITKSIAFVDNEENQHVFNLNIDPFEYENVWYFFEILQWPLLQRFDLIFIYNTKIIRENLKIKWPFKVNNLQLIFGGGLIVTQSNIETLIPGTKFSYFPGKLIMVKYEFKDIDENEDQEQLAREAFSPYQFCKCKSNFALKLEDISFNLLDKQVFTSGFINCNSFHLSGWLKITNIVQNSDEFTHQVINLKSNFQNQLSDKNLSPFSLYYRISSTKNQLIFTTYSYTFPTVTINFLNDQYLIKKEQDITNSLYLWQKLEVKLIETQLMISLKFYEFYEIYEYSIQYEVYQFKCTQFKLEYGNILQSNNNYLSIITNNFLFNNCDTYDILQNCHYSCQECDGPSKNDCLSCSSQSNRIYLPEFKACICPYHTIDQENCLSYLEQKLQISNENKVMPKCKYGYFEYEDICIHCPSTINDKLASCQECLLNPKEWSKRPYCENDLYLNQNGDVYSIQWYGYSYYYLYDGNDLTYCQLCNSSYSFIVDDYGIQNLEINLKNIHLLCSLYVPGCFECEITIYGYKCSSCYYYYKLVDGVCTQIDKDFSDQYCNPPYYLTSKRKCSLCPIPNCKYCFEYQANDLTKCTLYYNFKDFDVDTEAKIGCALCEDSFMFDFNSGICQLKSSDIENCLRSFIYEGEEICTLSKINDFSVAPEIINCQKYYPNCLQCIQTPQFIIKCVICQIGYTTSIQTGGCYQSDQYQKDGVEISIEGLYSLRDGWVQRIQSFMMKFLPNSYFYFQNQHNQLINQLAVECKDGYALFQSNNCLKFCDNQCKECKLNEYYSYQCQKCSLDYYYQTMRSQIDGKCFECSQLCLACNLRTNEEIYAQQAIFNIQNYHSIHTKKCLKSVQDPKIYLDPYDQIAKYCFDKTCSSQLKFYQEVYACEWFDSYWENQINIDYLNSQGIDSIVFHFNYNYKQVCQYFKFNIISLLKTKVFSLKYIHYILSSKDYMVMIINQITYVQNIDKFEINTLIFRNLGSFPYILENNNQKVELNLFNVTFKDSQNKNLKSMYQNKVYGDVLIKDVRLLNMKLSNSSMLNLVDESLTGIIIIESLYIQKCTFINSHLFYFTNNKVILFAKHILIEDSIFTNSSLFFADSNIYNQSIFDIFNVSIKRTQLFNSSLLIFKNYVTLLLINLNFESNILSFSDFVEFNYNSSLQYIQILDSQIIESRFIIFEEINQDQAIIVSIEWLEAQDILIQNSQFMKIFNNQQFTQIELLISNLIFQDIHSVNNTDLKQYLFDITCLNLRIQDLFFQNLKNTLIFYIFQSQDIILQNVVYKNIDQIYQVPYSKNCQIYSNDSNQLLKIVSFNTFKISTVQISNLFTVDESLFELQQRNELINSTQLEINDLIFDGNLLLFNESTKLFSLFIINSEWNINIKIKNIQFFDNCFHSIAKNFFKSYSSLLYFNTKTSQIQIINFKSERNVFTNSTNTFIYITSKSLIIQNLQVTNHNILSSQQWERFYGFKLDKLFNQQQINQVTFKIFNISNIGGVAQITTSNFTCQNCRFQNILAFKSAIFEIQVENLGIIQFNTLIANDIVSDLTQVTNSSGCINIYSQDGKLDIEISNSSFKKVTNRMSSSILSIQPSQIQNRIIFTDIQFQDCISFMNQILYVGLSSKISNKNMIKFQNILVTQQLELWLQLFQQIRNISQQELLDISGDQNSIIQIESFSIGIINFTCEGLYISPILKILDAPKIVLQNLEIRNFQRLYSFTLISIKQTIDIETTTIIQNVNIYNSSTFEAGSQKIYLTNIDFISDGCQVIAENSNEISENNSYYFLNQILTILEQHRQNLLSLIKIQSLYNKNSFYFNSIDIVQNNCKHCTQGLIYFNLISFQIIRISELRCDQNFIQSYGCLKILDENVVTSQILLLNSQFIQNYGSQGVAISSNKPIVIKSCKFIKNKASFRGGALYFEINRNQYLIQNSIIFGNQAKEGGGIYFSGDNNLDKKNFIQTFLKFNEASSHSNNLVESPTYLALLINSVEMQASTLHSDNIQTNILKIHPYLTIDQEMEIKTDYLLIPSGQTIKEFSLFIPKLSQIYKQIQTIEIIFKNSFNELQKDLTNSTCHLNDKIVKLNEEKINGSLNNLELIFNSLKNSFDLSTISFKIDPYNQEQKYLEISVKCSIQGYGNVLNYTLQAQSYKSQLGQFYIDQGCQICEPSKGFYSVTYNSIKCSIFDKEKFQEITSNAIKLKGGYWRPHYLSDETSFCFKIETSCIGGWNFGDSLCSKGHIGALCEECDLYNVRGNGKYLKNLQNSECLECFGIQDSIIPFFLNFIWAIVSIVLTLQSIEKSNDLFLFLKIKERFSQILFKLNLDLVSILIKMLLNYLWIFSVIFTFNINFSFQFNFVDQASNTSYSMANNLDCYLSDIVDIQVIYSKIILILTLILQQFIIIIFGLFIFSILVHSKFKSSTISNTLLCLYIFNYAGFIKMLCSLVSYREISQIKYVSGDLTLKFDSELHYQWMLYLIMPGLIIFGSIIPLSIFLLMYLKRKTLDLHTLRPHICYLFNEYEKESYYWEQIKLIKRAIMILILTYFETNIQLKASLIGLLMIVYQQLAVKKNPYIISKFNKLDLQTGQICSVSIFLSAIKYESERLNNQVVSVILSIILIILFIFISFPFIYNIVKIYYIKYKKIALNYLNLTFKYLKFRRASQLFENILDKVLKKEQRVKENQAKLRQFLIIVSKTQIKNRPAILTVFNTTKSYQQKLLSTEIQSILLTAKKYE